MNNKTAHHTWYFPSKGLKAIFDYEIRGQLSDGAWENATPYNHWRFWSDIDTKVSPKGLWSFEFNPSVDYAYKRPVKKTAYNLLTLVDPDCDLSNRMRAYYLDAELGIGLGRDAEYLTDSAIEGVRNLAAHPTRGEYWREKLAKLEAVDEQKVKTFRHAYALYTRKHLIADLRLIKKQMKAVIELAK
jgi:hypothetical protein